MFEGIRSRLHFLRAADSQQGNSDELTKIDKSNQRLSRPSAQFTWMRNMFGGQYNPDNLDYRVYNQMLEDPQIKAASRLITYFLLSKKWLIEPASDDPQDVEVADFIKDMISNFKTPMRQIRKETYTCIDYGYAVQECIYDFDEQTGKIIISDMCSVPIDTLEDAIELDDEGQIANVWQNNVAGGPIQIPGEKCMVSTFDEKFGNKYGESILKALYDTHFLKGKTIEWLSIYLEKMEGPTVVGIEGDGSSPDEMQANIDSIHEGTAGFTGKVGEEYKILESSHRGEAFFQAITYFDVVIFRAFIIGSLLLGQADAKGGSLAQSKTHFETVGIFLDGVHEDNAANFQEKINQVVDMNYTVEKYPKFHYEKFNKSDLIALLNALEPYAQNLVMSVDELGVDQLVERILKEYADITVDTNKDSEKPTTEPRPTTGEPLNNNGGVIDKIKNIIPGVGGEG